jgi:hypothetical protein
LRAVEASTKLATTFFATPYFIWANIAFIPEVDIRRFYGFCPYQMVISAES